MLIVYYYKFHAIFRVLFGVKNNTKKQERKYTTSIKYRRLGRFLKIYNLSLCSEYLSNLPPTKMQSVSALTATRLYTLAPAASGPI